jgi:hypothetical protein
MRLYSMPRRKNSFTDALNDAAKRYAKATKEREAAVKKLADLDAEIPALQQTIQALQRQLHPDDVTFRNRKNGKETTPSGEVRVPAIPPELAKYVGPQDLSGMGSIPAVNGKSGKELTEEELLELGDVK